MYFSLQFQLGIKKCSGQCTRWSPSQHQKFSQLRLFRRTTANKLSIRVKVNQKFTFFELLSLWTLLKWFWWGCHRGHNCVNLLIDFNQAAISRVNLVALSKWRPPSNTKVKCNMDWIEWTTSLKQSIFLLPSWRGFENLLTPWSIWRKFLTFLIAPLPPMYTGWENVIRENKPWGKTISYEIANSHSIIIPSKKMHIFGYFLVCWDVTRDVTVGRLCWLYLLLFGCISLYLVEYLCSG